MIKEDLHIGLLQLDSLWNDPMGNVSLIDNHLSLLSVTPDLLVLPEMWSTGFVMNPKRSAVSLHHPAINALQEVAAKYDVAILGSQAVADGIDYYNRVLLSLPDSTKAIYDKQYLFAPAGEGVAYTAGEGINDFSFAGWNIRPQVCYDLRFPEGVRNGGQPDLIIYMANWPSARIYHWDQLLIARAIENQCYVAACNRTGTDGNGWQFPGHSAVIDHMGNVVKQLGSDHTYGFATLQHSAAKHYREKMPFHQDKKF